MGKVFSSFKKDFPIDDRSRLFISNLLEKDLLQELENAFESLTTGVVLTKEIYLTTGARPIYAYVYEVNVDINGDTFCVDEKV